MGFFMARATGLATGLLLAVFTASDRALHHLEALAQAFYIGHGFSVGHCLTQHLAQARLGGVNLTGADLTGCNVTGASVASAVLQGIKGADRIIGLDRTLHLDRAFRD